MIKKLTPAEKMVEVSKGARSRNSEDVAYTKVHGLHTRIEDNRHTDLPMVTMCLRQEPPAHVKQDGKGVFLVDLPADVFKTVWFTLDGYTVATYKTRADRKDSL